jgi:hypothetical protein
MTSTEQWAKKINKAWQRSVDSFFECGRLLIAAKEGPKKLPHGQFQRMIENELRFGPRVAQMFMSIARNAWLAQHASHCPQITRPYTDFRRCR